MDFTNEYYFFGAGAAIGFILGALLMKAWRKYIGENWELKIARDWLKTTEEQLSKTDTERQNYYYEIMRLKRELEELRAIDERTAQKEAHIKKLDERIKEEIETFNKLNKINRDIRRKDEIEQYENEVRAEKEARQAQRQAQRQERQQADDALDEYRAESKNIGTKPPKNMD